MIKQIDYIRNFGIFRDFRWDESLSAFAKINLLYGWNYSGKTTLSRIFQIMGGKTTLPEEYSSARFELVFDDGSKFRTGDTLSAFRILVFNRDYIQQNFEKEHTASAVFILGEENRALRNRLRVLTNRRDRVVTFLREFKAKHHNIKEQLDKAGTDKARDIGNLLGVRNFRRPDLESRIGEIREDPDRYILTDEEVSAHLQTLRGIEHYDSIDTPQINLPNMNQVAREVNELIGQTASNRAIKRLQENPQVESWVRRGLALHEDKRICEFCGNELTEGRLNLLKGHFSEEYERLVQQVDAKIKVLESAVPSPKIPDEGRIIGKERMSYTQAKERLNEWIQWARNTRDDIIRVLKEKLVAIETPLNWSGNLDKADEGTRFLSDLNESIDRHNSAVKDMEGTKAEVREVLEKHYTAQYLKEGDALQWEADLDTQQKKIERAEQLMERIDEKIKDIEAKTRESSIGAEKLSSLIKYLLADSNIEVEPVGDATFQFKRNGRLATYLSEGEKTAITFAHFVTNLEARDASIEETIVFIDDPVSSLDSNHTYAVFALITEQLTKAHQLFIATHNMELFNLLKSRWLDRRGGNTTEGHAYHVWRFIDSDGKPRAELRDLPRLLRSYKSEYEFIFAQLHRFASAADPTLHEAYTAPNLLRKFLEAYLGFRKALPREWWKKLDLLLDEPESQREVHKFANEESHLQALGRVLAYSDLISNAQRCVRMVLDGLQAKDPNHYKSLVEIVGGGQ